MNPDRIYRQYRDDALAEQAGSDRYSTFVAMPFEETFRYRSRSVLDDVIVTAAREATSRGGLRPFEDPHRAGQSQGAVEITEEILTDILRCHLFVADLTLGNPNVCLELGVALGLKPSAQIILLLDGDPKQLPFNIKDNMVIRYDCADHLARLADAFMASARAFELDYRSHVTDLRRRLSSDAIWLMRHLASLQARGLPPIMSGDEAPEIFVAAENPRLRYALGEGELIRNRVVEMEHEPRHEADAFATRPTPLGQRLIGETWLGSAAPPDEK
jgi:hypothetical protein